MTVLKEFLEFIEQSGPQPVQRLLQRVLLKSRELTGAEAGTVFIVRGRGQYKRLEASNTQNEVIKVKPADFVVPITTSSLAGYTAVTGETVFVDDLYAISDNLPYSFDPSFDTAYGYRSRSMLCFPLHNYSKKVIGVLQLINRRDDDGSGPKPFDRRQADLIVPFNHIIGNAIERAAMAEHISGQNKRLRERNKLLAAQREHIVSLQHQTEEAFQLSINLLARAAELHDENTAQHVERVNEYSYYLAGLLGMPAGYCDEIRFSAQLHDVGKMSINAAILRKKGKLNEEEFEEMRRHPEYGFQILSASGRLKMAANIALNHHEQWDGQGYPNGVQGEAIPISARIVAMADIYDALRSARPYKLGYSHEQTLDIMLNGDARINPESHFDPELLELLRHHHHGMEEVWQRLGE